MQPEDGPDEVSGESVATTGQQEDPPEGTAGELTVNTERPEDPPDGTAGDPLAGTGHPEVELDENLPEITELQVAQQLPALADHIQQHQDIEAAAQDRADAAIQRIRREIESQYHFAFDRAIREIRSDQNRNFNKKLDETIAQFKETLEGLAREYSGKLQDLEAGTRDNREQHDRLMEEIRSAIKLDREEAGQRREELEWDHRRRLATLAEDSQRERAEQLEQYRQICTDTTGDLTEKVDGVIRANARTIDSKLREHRTESIREQQRKTLEAIAAAEAKWKKRTAVILTVTLTASALAIAALLTAVL